jgi:hypothetical protein
MDDEANCTISLSRHRTADNDWAQHWWNDAFRISPSSAFKSATSSFTLTTTMGPRFGGKQLGLIDAT